MAKGVNHYTKDGKKWTGGVHKMPNGQLHSGKTHGTNSKRLYHFAELSDTAKKRARGAKDTVKRTTKKRG